MSLSKRVLIELKQGKRFDYSIVIPVAFADGYFVGSTLKSSIRDRNGILVSELNCQWLDPATTREILLEQSTVTWPLGRIYGDVLISRASDGLSEYTNTFVVKVHRSYTRASG